MGMDLETGKIRALDSADQLKENEVLFTVGEILELKGCQFQVEAIQADPDNQVTLKGIPKDRGLGPETSPSADGPSGPGPSV